jgi:hypothetical protein
MEIGCATSSHITPALGILRASFPVAGDSRRLHAYVGICAPLLSIVNAALLRPLGYADADRPAASGSRSKVPGKPFYRAVVRVSQGLPWETAFGTRSFLSLLMDWACERGFAS